MKKLNQEETPFLTSVTEYIGKKVVPFDVPGHHMGNMDSRLKNCLGKKVFEFDINAPIGLDNLAHPAGVLKAAEDLMAQATGADNAFFLINGTSSGILAMLLTVCKAEDKIILPRNVHKSIINGLILSGAAPIFVMPTIDMELEIANQPTLDDYKKAIIKYPSAKAVFVINPTYFGAVADLANLVKFAHAHNVTVLVDEAHGAHFYFSETGPRSAMDCGADLTAISFHKTAGSLTQSSVLLQQGNRVTADAIQRVLNMINTTSPSSILMASLDSARQYMAMHGAEAMEYTFELVDYAIKKIDNIKGFIVCNEKHFLKKGCYDYDRTKLVLELDKISLSGFEVYYKLQKEYGVQVELAETYTILCIITAGTTKAHINALAKALNAISKQYYSKQLAYPRHSFSVKFPFQLLRPRLAFDAPNKCVNIKDAEYQVSNESIMIYPPGIPLIIPGEVFTPTLIKRINNYKKTGITILSHYDNGNVDIVNLENWKKYKSVEIKLKEYEMNHLISPRSDDYIAPFEGKEHQGTLMLLPYRSDTWRLHGEKARANYLEVVRAIAKYEKVYLGIDPSIYTKVIDECMELKNVECLKIKYNDAWARDNMPIFVSNGEKLRCVDFRFNAWGGTFDGLYSDYQDDDKLSAKIAKYFNLESYHVNDFIFEGGSISLDGEGTCLVTEACLLSEGRNPQYSKYEIEEMIKEYFNISKVIWLKHGIYKDETNEHVDNMACFARPGVVLLAWCDDKEDPQYKYSQNVYRKLSKEKDAQGMPFKIIKVRIPGPLYVTAEESKGVTKSRHDAKARLANDRLAGSYINFYQSDKFVILPSFGVTQDEVTLRQFKKIFPEKDIIQMNTREILLGGGNIHCITMQIPKVEGKREC